MKPVFGANYFPGWWDGPENYWFVDGRHILEAHPERTPLLGTTASPSLLAKEAEAAHSHGITFFNFLWYGVSIQKPLRGDMRPGMGHVNSALESFLQICEGTPLRFSIEWTNHDPWCAIDNTTWRRLVEKWIPIFANPSYMTVDGRLLFKVHSWHCWATGGIDQYRRRRLLQYLREAVRDRTGREMLIGAGVRRMESIVRGHPLQGDGTFDFTNIYLDVPNLDPNLPDFVGPGVFAYDELEMHQEVGRAFHAYDAVPFVPNVIVGFSPLSHAQAGLPRYRPPSAGQFRAAVDAAIRDVRRYPGLRFPSGAAEPTPLLLFYSWNEFAEGGFLAPSNAYGTTYLEVLRSIIQGNDGPSARL
jgi:hypothetical protein